MTTAEALLEPSRVRDAASCRDWLAGLSGAGAGRLAAVERLWRSLELGAGLVEQQYEIAEQARPAHLAEITATLERLDPGVFPTPERERARLLTALSSLALGRDVYRRIHVRMQEEALADPVSIGRRELEREAAAGSTVVRPGGGDPAALRSTPVSLEDKGVARASGRSASALPVSALRAVIPLVRALDYQARLLATMQRLRVSIDSDEWETLCMLGEALRASTFLDTQMPDPSPLLGRRATARALFVYPLLLRLAAPWSRTPGEFALVARLARRWAGLVGFRLDEAAGAQADLRHGPALMLSDRRTVRLVTRRLQRRLAERRRDLDTMGARLAERLPKGISLSGARQLLDDLDGMWCEPRIVQNVPDVPLGRMGLRFGMPRLDDGEAGQRERRPAALHAAATRAYIYGRFEHNTIIRQALDPRRPVDPMSAWAEGADAADWVSIERQQAVFETDATFPGLELGALALVVAPRAEGPTLPARRSGAEAARGRMFGRVVSLAQRLPKEAGQPTRRRIGLTVWSGVPALAGLRIGEFAQFVDAFVLCPDAATGEPASLVLAPGSFAGPALATLRESMRDRRIRLEELLDRGRQFDRVRFSVVQA